MRRFITGKKTPGEPVSQSFSYSRSRPALTPPPALNPGEAGTHTGHTRRRDTGHMWAHTEDTYKTGTLRVGTPPPLPGPPFASHYL